jgi:hypothetical protein
MLLNFLKFVQSIVCLFLILDWCDLFAAMVCGLFLLACLLVVIFTGARCVTTTSVLRRGGSFEYQEEDQGQANQGKPSKLVSYLIPILLIA